MFPSPLDIPSSIDCLAHTGTDPLPPLLLGLVAVVVGVAVLLAARGRMRRTGVALGLALLLAAGGAGLALAAPATSASADDCTALDYRIDAELDSPAIIDSGDQVITEFWITNVVDRNGTPPIVVRVPKFEGSGNPISFAGANWTMDHTSDADYYLFTYDGPLPTGTQSSIAAFSFTLTTIDTDLEHFSFPVEIVPGSGGDTNTANNTAVLTTDADGTVDYAISGTVTPDTAAPASPLTSGGTAQIDFALTNVLPRDGHAPLVVLIPMQPAISNVSLAGSSTGWALTLDAPYYYVLTYSPVLLEGQQSSTATVTFTASNGNSSPATLSIPVGLAIGSGGDTNSANDSTTFALRVEGVVP